MAHKRESVRIVLPMGGFYLSGDPAALPEKKTASIANFCYRLGKWVTRPSYVATAITTGMTGFATWQDEVNDATRVVAAVTNAGNTDLRVQNTGGVDTFGAAISGVTGTGAIDSTNYHGQLFITSKTTKIFSFDGTTVTADAIGGETIAADSIASYIDRLFFGRLRPTTSNLLSVSQSYDPVASWSTTKATVELITSGTNIAARVTPTDTSGAIVGLTTFLALAASATDTNYRYLCALRNTSADSEVPVTIQVVYNYTWTSATYAVGDIRTPSNQLFAQVGYRFRVKSITTGVAGATEPTWDTKTGATTVDGGVTWICDGSHVAGEIETTIPSLSEQPNFTVNNILATFPPSVNGTRFRIRIMFGTTASPVITAAALEMSFRDGKADGNLLKKNFGQQVTKGRFGFDFYNQESSQTATTTYDDRVYWTETSNSNDIRGNNFFRCREVAGRLVVFKKRGMWVFLGTADPDNPIRLEKFYSNVGCLSTKTIDVFEDALYFVGAEEVYRWTPNSDPIPLAKEAARESLFPAGASTPYPSSVAVDGRNREVVFGQSNTIAGMYHEATDDWIIISAGDLGSDRISAYSYTTGHVFTAPVGGGIFVNSGTALTDPTGEFQARWTPKTLDAPSGYQLHVKQLYVRLGQTSGATATLTVTPIYTSGPSDVIKNVTVSLTGPSALGQLIDVPIPIYQTGDTFRFDFTYTPLTVDNKLTVISVIADCDLVPSINPYAPGTSGSL